MERKKCVTSYAQARTRDNSQIIHVAVRGDSQQMMPEHLPIGGKSRIRLEVWEAGLMSSVRRFGSRSVGLIRLNMRTLNVRVAPFALGLSLSLAEVSLGGINNETPLESNLRLADSFTRLADKIHSI